MLSHPHREKGFPWALRRWSSSGGGCPSCGPSCSGSTLRRVRLPDWVRFWRAPDHATLAEPRSTTSSRVFLQPSYPRGLRLHGRRGDGVRLRPRDDRQRRVPRLRGRRRDRAGRPARRPGRPWPTAVERLLRRRRRSAPAGGRRRRPRPGRFDWDNDGGACSSPTSRRTSPIPSGTGGHPSRARRRRAQGDDARVRLRLQHRLDRVGLPVPAPLRGQPAAPQRRSLPLRRQRMPARPGAAHGGVRGGHGRQGDRGLRLVDDDGPARRRPRCRPRGTRRRRVLLLRRPGHPRRAALPGRVRRRARRQAAPV